jgi:alanine racemase
VVHAERSTRAIVDLGAVSHNVEAIRKRIGPTRGLMAIVKADGYGHGAVPVAREALASGSDWLGVTFPEEGLALRKEGIDVPILVLGLIRPDEAQMVVACDLDQTVASGDILPALDRAAARAGKKLAIHLKVDTGMGRIGVGPDEAVPLARQIERFPHLELSGVFSHLATADSADKSFAREQIATFERVLAGLKRAGIEVPFRHLANSAAVLDLPEAWYDLVRPGTAVYGLYPSPDVSRSIALRPAMTLATQVAAVRTVPAGTSISYGRTFITGAAATTLATLPLGYADGLNRALSNRWEVLVRGERAPLVGTICMDMAVADVSHVAGVEPGDDVVLFGEDPAIEEMAARIGTISYEVACSIGKRVPRTYIRKSGKPGDAELTHARVQEEEPVPCGIPVGARAR